ncbi:MAG TPA: molybdenum ABC transporter ATP-binding protein [Burkholderiales bacterium]|nr:molybdenum ABC transporter ATP-binding protein [Burkholderiales bacterium]
MTLTVDIERRLGAFRLDAAFEAGAGITALFGRSGAGKTSLVNAIAGILRPDRGRIVIGGEAVFDAEAGIDVPTPARRIGYVFQEGRLFPHLSVAQNLRYAGLFSRGAPASQFAHVAELLGLKELLERRPGNLSGGEKQRVAIGRALLSSPRLLLLDEPLASLDAHRKNEVMQYIELLRDEIRIPVVYVSHSAEEVVRLADTVVLLSAGEVSAVGAAEDVMGRPDLRAATGAFEGGAVIEAKVTAQDMDSDLATLAFDGGTLTAANVDALIGEPVRVRIRARDVSIALERPRRISIQNVLEGTIVEVRAGGNGAVDVAIAVGATTLRSRVTQRASQQLGLAKGLPVYALVKAVSLSRAAAG